MKVQNLRAKILANRHMAPHAYKMKLLAAAIARKALPGQFVMVRCADSCRPLLRRPFSVHSAKGSNIEVLYEVIGEGTKILLLKKPGEYLDIIGPLGSGFNYREPKTENRKPILVAGGIGAAPLLFLAQKLKGPAMVLIGARTKSEILCEKEFKNLGCEVKIATDNGSRGRKGFVTELLKSVIARSPEGARAQRSGASPKGTKQSPRGDCFASLRSARNDVSIYACGPKLMLKEIADISRQHKIPAQVSLEEHMACGIGACLGCVVRTKNGLKRVCKEGPVFNADEIVW